ncbi:anoctamin-9 [Rhinatrema bivittatum]|uniref:anoctamin-9 n=1 Tax=Rhinatrema bivittatum TaxID=194408 RepID=UPI001125E7F0|nr:anoctamin-9 [Rhinatrema bivittatum]
MQENDGLLTPWRENLLLLTELQEASIKWDFVLVCNHQNDNTKLENKRRMFLAELEMKRFKIKKIQEKTKTFYGISAPPDIFQKYVRLLRNPDKAVENRNLEDQVSVTSRIRIVDFILYKTEIISDTEPEKLRDLIRQDVFETAFPLHDLNNELGKDLKKKWARWRDVLHAQPVAEIRDYFGEKVALYFAWLGWYTIMLFPAAVVGSIVFLYGLVHFSSSQISKEICEANTTIMCPLCDQKCPYWNLSETCTYAKVTHLFDNEGTVFFAMFMALWATVFLELWKRQRAKDVFWWNLYSWDEDEEELALELINNPECVPQKHEHSYLSSILVLLGVSFMIAILIGIAQAIVIYRVIVTVFFMKSDFPFIREHANTAAVLTGAVVHYLTIVIMTKVNRAVAMYLSALEKPRTFTERENNFTVKVFTFQFFTHFSSLIYVAFFLGRINGRPGNYVRIAGQWRLEECHPSGCIMDLFIQMVVIMVLKQTLSNCVEFLSPYLKYKFRTFRDKPKKKDRVHTEEMILERCKEEWQRNYRLGEVNVFSLFDEFLEMVIQYSFTTIFVAAFPLAPLLAFMNNVIEIRLDAIKMVRLQRRMVPRKANDIGIWLQVLEGIGVLAVIANGLVIAITSDFIPRLVYKYTYGPCAQGNDTDLDCLTGYINHSLSVFHIQDFEQHTQPFNPTQIQDIVDCRYRDYRKPDDYSFSVQFWHIFAARLAFVILFEHVAVCIKFIAAWFVPDIPQSVKNKDLLKKQAELLDHLSVIDHSIEV